jgi:hypothetical protein
MIAQDEIVYCNIKASHNGKVIHIKEVVYKKENDYYYRKKVLDKFKIEVPVKILSIEIIKRLGFGNKNN